MGGLGPAPNAGHRPRRPTAGTVGGDRLRLFRQHGPATGRRSDPARRRQGRGRRTPRGHGHIRPVGRVALALRPPHQVVTQQGWEVCPRPHARRHRRQGQCRPRRPALHDGAGRRCGAGAADAGAHAGRGGTDRHDVVSPRARRRNPALSGDLGGVGNRLRRWPYRPAWPRARGDRWCERPDWRPLRDRIGRGRPARPEERPPPRASQN